MPGGISKMLKFFDVKHPFDVRFVHAVNDQAHLAKVCADKTVQMLEGDIACTVDGRVVMGHPAPPPAPPILEGGLPFEDWLVQATEAGKGIKLDFKSPLAVERCFTEVKRQNLSVPLIVNADVLLGPGGRRPSFQGRKFVKQCVDSGLPDFILSLGWTTKCRPDLGYSSKMIDEMLELVRDYQGDVTLPVRICYLRGSYAVFQKALQKENITITLWNNEKVDRETHDWIARHIDPAKTFYDYVEY